MVDQLLANLRKSSLCGEGAELTLTTLVYEIENTVVTVTGVPAVVCPNTGEELVPGPLGVKIGELVQRLIETSELYDESSPDLDSPPRHARIDLPMRQGHKMPV